jgi:hypothetical protein
VSGQLNSWEFRKDCLGNLVRYADFGNRHSPFGWELDYIVSRAMGGSTAPDNLQALHWKATAARSESLPAGLVSGTNAVAKVAKEEEFVPM